MSLQEAAERLGVHYMTAYRYVRSGQIEAAQVNGQWQITPEAVDSFRTNAKASNPRSGSRGPSSASVKRRLSTVSRALIDGDEVEVWRSVQGAFDEAWDSRTIYLDLVAESLRIIGDGWASGSVSIAEEHRATVIAMRIIGGLGSRYRRPGRKKGTVVLAAAPGDLHGLPTAIVADLLRIAGFRVTDLGADVPASQLPVAAESEDRLHAVAVCATTTLDSHGEEELRQALALTRGAVDCPIILGGAAIDSAAHAIELGADLSFVTTDELLDWFEGPTTSTRPASQAPHHSGTTRARDLT